MFRSVIIEDDPFHLEVLRDLIASHFPQISVEGTGGMSSEGVLLIRSLKPDLVFLDIDLPDKSGFEMLEDLQDEEFDIVFVTSHEKYAFQAHQFDSIGYLLKPISFEALDQVIRKLTGNKHARLPGNEFLKLLNAFRSTFDIPRKIAIPSLKDIHYVPISDIVRLEADGNYSRLFMNDGSNILSSRQIGEYETRLKQCAFFRIHDKHLVNIRYVRSFIKGEAGTAILEDQTQLPVARRRKDEFFRLLDEMFS